MGLYDKKIILPNESLKFNYIDKLIDDFFEELFTKYSFNSDNYFVDVGCGKGIALWKMLVLT